jgi:hypothetical protein
VGATGRNQPCDCGSGRKAKLCCGVRRGPSESDLARAFLAAQARWAAPVLGRALDDIDEMTDLFGEVADLPDLDLSCQLRLPRLGSPALEELREAVAAEDEDWEDEALPAALAEVDTPVARAGLARAVIELRDGGQVSPEVAAAALLDLETDGGVLVCEALLAAVAVQTGTAATPSGLILLG